MKKGRLIFVFVFAAIGISTWFVLNSFKQDSVTPNEFISWVNDKDNKLWASKEIDEYKFSLLYKPLDYIVINEHKEDQLTQQLIEEGKKKYKGMQYYTLRIESSKGEELLKSGINDDNAYYQRLEYFMTSMQEDISLVDGKDTLPCLLFHYERDYGLSPYGQFVMGFEEQKDTLKKGNNDKQLMFSDRTFGLGIVNIVINGKSIDKVPSIKL